MRSMPMVLCTVLVFGLVHAVFAQTLTPKGVIQNLRQAYGKVQSLKATVRFKMRNTEVVSSLQLVRPRQYLVEIKQNGKPILVYSSDGKTLTQYDPSSKTYVQQPLRPDTSLAATAPIVGFFMPLAMDPKVGEMLQSAIQESFNKAQAKGTQKVGTVSCKVIELTGKEGTLTLYIGAKDGLVYRVTAKEPNGQVVFEETVTSLQLNPSIPKTVFAFRPPAGATKQETPRVAQREEVDTSSLKGQDAPAFALADLEGNTVSLSDLKGKVIFIDFWATWCPPCRESLPHTQALSQHEKAKSGDLVVLAINAREEVDEVKSFLQEKGYTFRVLLDKDGAVMNQFKVQGIPTFVIIDREGKVAWVQVGFSGGTEKLIDEAVNKALGL